MVFSGVLHGVNPGLSPVSVVVDQSGMLVLDRENWVTTLGLPLELPQAPDGRSLKIFNSTTAAITVNSSPGTISGVTQAGVAITAQNAVRILPGQRGTFVANGGNWIAQGCEPSVLTFTYNGVPLSNNTSNPLNASDLFHWLGQEAAKGSGQPWVNPTGTSWLTSASSGASAGWGLPSCLSNRASSSGNFTEHCLTTGGSNGWYGWRLPGSFRPTGVLILGNSTNGPFLSDVDIKLSTGSNLSSVDTWATVLSLSGLSMSNGQWHYANISTGASGNLIGIISTSTTTEKRLGSQEVLWYGDYSP
jgi:hypothetical protein